MTDADDRAGTAAEAARISARVVEARRPKTLAASTRLLRAAAEPAAAPQPAPRAELDLGLSTEATRWLSEGILPDALVPMIGTPVFPGSADAPAPAEAEPEITPPPPPSRPASRGPIRRGEAREIRPHEPAAPAITSNVVGTARVHTVAVPDRSASVSRTHDTSAPPDPPAAASPAPDAFDVPDASEPPEAPDLSDARAVPEVTGLADQPSPSEAPEAPASGAALPVSATPAEPSTVFRTHDAPASAPPAPSGAVARMPTAAHRPDARDAVASASSAPVSDAAPPVLPSAVARTRDASDPPDRPGAIPHVTDVPVPDAAAPDASDAVARASGAPVPDTAPSGLPGALAHAHDASSSDIAPFRLGSAIARVPDPSAPGAASPDLPGVVARVPDVSTAKAAGREVPAAVSPARTESVTASGVPRPDLARSGPPGTVGLKRELPVADPAAQGRTAVARTRDASASDSVAPGGSGAVSPVHPDAAPRDHQGVVPRVDDVPVPPSQAGGDVVARVASAQASHPIAVARAAGDGPAPPTPGSPAVVAGVVHDDVGPDRAGPNWPAHQAVDAAVARSDDDGAQAVAVVPSRTSDGVASGSGESHGVGHARDDFAAEPPAGPHRLAAGADAAVLGARRSHAEAVDSAGLRAAMGGAPAGGLLLDRETGPAASLTRAGSEATVFGEVPALDGAHVVARSGNPVAERSRWALMAEVVDRASQIGGRLQRSAVVARSLAAGRRAEAAGTARSVEPPLPAEAIAVAGAADEGGGGPAARNAVVARSDRRGEERAAAPGGGGMRLARVPLHASAAVVAAAREREVGDVAAVDAHDVASVDEIPGARAMLAALRDEAVVPQAEPEPVTTVELGPAREELARVTEPPDRLDDAPQEPAKAAVDVEAIYDRLADRLRRDLLDERERRGSLLGGLW